MYKYKSKYSNINLEDLKKHLEDYFQENINSISDVFVKEMSEGVYRLPGGVIVGKCGLNEFEKIFKEKYGRNYKIFSTGYY